MKAKIILEKLNPNSDHIINVNNNIGNIYYRQGFL
jgi:hypothetical protein